MRVPTFRLIYDGTDITSDIKALTESVEFVDRIDGKESDEVSITLDNSDLRWLGSWIPKEGDSISLQMGYVGESMLGPIGFQVDEPEWTGTPDILTLKGQATPVKSSLRQKNNVGWEGVSLRDIASQIASKHGLTVVNGEKLPNVKLDRVTQRNQSDLEFLQQQSNEFGLLFKIDSVSRLVFYSERELEEAAPIATITRQQCTSYRLKRGAVGTYVGVSFNYLDAGTGEYEEVNLDASGEALVTQKDGEDEVATSDQLVIKERFGSREEGEIRAREALRRANRGSVEGEIQLEGDATLSGGSNISLAGFGAMSGKYQIKQATHRIERSSGYTLRLELTGLGTMSDAQPVSA